ncbi:TerC family protein [Photobacterium halotolerans]|uniref:TerC family protein n=1 Tax=Photobacterium halotolerans TaxID=265726 RepID=UPI0013731163|nr:TerC family protein [Photobacterium halotolerans]NAW88863.1 TerC/Alx family metal homeostasis membrane protein [Photobacterium halotolerans]
MDMIWLWIGFNLFVILLLALDLGVLHRGDRVIAVREALLLSLGYVILALLFAAGIFAFMSREAGYAFLTGYFIEKSLSVDNIFVFVLIFMHFSVPPQSQYRVLFWGVLFALVLRGSLIWAGTAVIDTFHWMIYLFGAFLVFTGIKMLVTVSQTPDLDKNRVAVFMRRHFRVTEGFVGQQFFVRRNGLLYMTPLFITLVLVELTDVVFALDSIPAIFAITTDPFIIYTSNVFAILGLRALYFALVGVIHRFHYLKYGLSLVLIFVGVKMLVNAYFGTKLIPTELALLITAVLIGGSMVISIVRTRNLTEAERTAEADKVGSWWVPGSPARSDKAKQPPKSPK